MLSLPLQGAARSGGGPGEPTQPPLPSALPQPSAHPTHPTQILELVLGGHLGVALLISSKVGVAQMQDAGHDAQQVLGNREGAGGDRRKDRKSHEDS